MNKPRTMTTMLALVTSLALLTACPGRPRDIKVVQKMESFLQEPVEITCKPKNPTRPAKTFKLAPGEVTVLELGVSQGYFGDFMVEPLACETEGKSFILCQHESQFAGLSHATSNLDEVKVGYQLRPVGERCEKPFHQADPLLRMPGEWKTACISKPEENGLALNSTQVTLQVVGKTFNLVSREYSDADCESEKYIAEVQGSLAIDEEQISYRSAQVKASPAKASVTPKSEEAVAELKSSYCGKNASFAIDVPTELKFDVRCNLSNAPFSVSTTPEADALVLTYEYGEDLHFDRVDEEAE